MFNVTDQISQTYSLVGTDSSANDGSSSVRKNLSASFRQKLQWTAASMEGDSWACASDREVSLLLGLEIHFLERKVDLPLGPDTTFIKKESDRTLHLLGMEMFLLLLKPEH